jgi:VanZ family protein
MPITPCNCAGIRLLLGLALLITTWLSLTPQPMPLPDVALADKWVHLLAYVILGFLVDASWPERGFNAPKWLFLIAYGLAIELIQSQIPNRFLSIGDLLANIAGIAVYAFVLLPMLRGQRLR